jgi:PAS domain S-box-containing protein
VSEANDKKLANALPEVIWTCDPEGRLEWVNDRWVELTGMSLAETLTDKGGLLAVHPDDRASVQQRFAQAVATGEPCELEYRIRTRAGVHRWHFCRVVPLREDEGAISGWVAAAFDIEERKSAEEARLATERRFAAIFHLNPQPTAITRLSDGTYLDVNQAFLDLTGFAREEIIGRNALDLGILTAEQRAKVVRAATERNVEIPWRSKDGRELILVVNVARTELDGEDCLVGVSTDVTDRKAADAALRHSEAQARARADELAALMDAVPAAVWDRRRSAVPHHPRQPRRTRDPADERGRERVEDGRRSGGHLALRRVRGWR